MRGEKQLTDSAFKDAIFYVMSGTGNTHRLARQIKSIARPYVQDLKIVMIDNREAVFETTVSRDSLVGVLFPAHGFMPPWSMLKFLLSMQRQNGVAALCAATRGGLRAGRLTIPGVAGLATFLAAVLMLLKGYRPRALFSLDMPSNFINLHWGLHPKNIATISERTQQKLTHLVPRIMRGQRVFWTRNNICEAFWGLLVLWLFPLFPIAYLLIGKLYMAKLMFSNNRCVGCGRCARFCPNQAIEMRSTGKTKRPYWTYHCEVCLRCMGYCSKKAVEAGHSWAVVLYFLGSVPVISYWLHRLRNTYFDPPQAGHWLAYAPLDYIDFITALLLSYWAFWYLMRIPMFNTLFTYTTLTHYFRRYHQPETKLRHLGTPPKHPVSMGQKTRGEIEISKEAPDKGDNHVRTQM